MNLGLGLGATGLLCLARRGGPASLFQDADIGALFDATDPRTLFQDVAGTLPITAPGQSVALMRDLSPRGLQAEQATAAARPTWQVDANGRGHLAFDGIDDGMATALATWGTGTATLVAAVHKGSDAARAMILEGSGLQVFSIEAPHAAGVSSIGVGHQGASVVRRHAIAPALAAPVSSIVAARCDLGAPLVTIRINGVDVGQSTAATGGGVFNATPLLIGRRSGGSLPFTGRLYALFAINRLLTQDQIRQVERWMQTKSGVS